jgi:LysM repeat protein
MKVSKVILIVVALHVLVIGGIFIFEGCTRTKTTDITGTTPGDEGPATDKATANATTLPTPTTPDVASLTPTTPATPASTGLTSINPQPIGPVAPAQPAAPAARTHIVKKGESPIKIAKAEKVTLAELLAANNLTKTSVLKIGQKLTIPGKAEAAVATAAPATVTAPVAPATATVEGATYVVKSGDSLWKIAHAQKVTVSALKQANNLKSDALKVGQKLTIPTAAPATASAAAPATTAPVAAAVASTDSTTTHVVDIGETPVVIAKKYGVKVDDLMKANKITDPRKVLVGQKLTIPTVATAAPAAVPAATTPAAPVTTTMTPTVQTGPIVATAAH